MFKIHCTTLIELLSDHHHQSCRHTHITEPSSKLLLVGLDQSRFQLIWQFRSEVIGFRHFTQTFEMKIRAIVKVVQNKHQKRV